MDFTMENLENLILQFYSDDVAVRTHAHQLLNQAQASPEAWRFVWMLLQPDKPQEVQFFAATTLFTKVTKSWEDVPAEQYDNFKKELLQSILNLSTGPSNVKKKLCVVMAWLILNTISSHWKNAVPEIISALEPSNVPNVPPAQAILILLDILTALGEEYESVQLRDSRRAALRVDMENNSVIVLQLLERILGTDVSSSTDESTYNVIKQAVLCSSAWFILGIPLSHCESIATHLVNSAGRIKTSPHFPDLRNEVLELIMESLTNMITHPNTYKFPKSVLSMIPKLLAMKQIMQQDLQPDPDLIMGMYSLLISLAETHTGLLLNTLIGDEDEHKNNVLQIIQAILECSNSPGTYPVDETTSTIAFGIWFMLQDEILNCEPEQVQKYKMFLVPIYKSLTEIILNKAQVPPLGLPQEDREKFRIYRQDSADTLMYCYNILQDDLMELLLQKLDEAMFKLKQDPLSWPLFESCVFAFTSISESIVTNESPHLQRFFATVQQIPLEVLDSRAVASIIEAIGSYAEWINNNPQYLPFILPLLLGAINSPLLAPSATMALKDLTRDSEAAIAPFATVILASAQQVLRDDELKLNECVRLMFTVGKMLSTLPVDMIMNYLDNILTPYFKELEKHASSEVNPIAKCRILCRLKMMSALLSTLNVNSNTGEDSCICGNPQQPQQQQQQQPQKPQIQPVLLVLQQLLPVFQTLIENWCADFHVIEVICAALKYSITTLGDEAIDSLSDITYLVLKSYKLHPHPPPVELTKHMLIMYGNNANSSVVLRMSELFYQICGLTLDMVGQDQEKVQNNSDILEVFFNLLSHMVKKMPKLFVSIQEANIVRLFQLGILSLSVGDTPAVKACTMFLVNFISKSRETQPLLSVVHSYGEPLAQQILRNIGGDLPRTSLDPMTDLLLILNKKHCDSLSRWLNMAIQMDHAVPLQRATKEQKLAFVRNVLKEKANKRKLQEVVREFSMQCRGLIGLEFPPFTLRF